MEKTVRVTDEQGNLYEATYPKRAKGLFKHGRARFVDEDTICLTCPPDKISEETAMSEQLNSQFVLEPAEILKRIEEIQNDNGHIYQALSTLEKIPSIRSDVPGAPEDSAGCAKARAIAEIVKIREATNQKLLDFYMSLFREATGMAPASSQ